MMVAIFPNIVQIIVLAAFYLLDMFYQIIEFVAGY